MLRGIYTAASGMLKDMQRQDVVANNLANVSTPGYKRDMAVCRSFADLLIQRENDQEPAGRAVSGKNPIIGSLGFGTGVYSTVTIHEPGGLQETDNPLDVAIAGEGYFVVDTPQGRRYTRDGSFTLNADGVLTDGQGQAVLGQQGPITIQGGEPVIDQTGRVFVNGQEVDRLQIVSFNNLAGLQKVGDNFFTTTENPVPLNNPQVKQGFLEDSNVNVVREMVEMIDVMRSYEANQKVVQAQDGTLEKTVNEVGKV